MRPWALIAILCIGCGVRGAPGTSPARRGAESTITAAYRSIDTPPATEEPPPILDPVAAPILFAPREPGAESYGGPHEPAAARGLEEAVLALGRRYSSSVTLDGRLSRACAQLAEIAPASGALSEGVVEYARQRNGVPEPEPSFIVVRADPDRPAAVAARLRERITEQMFHGPAVRLGVGVGPGQGERAIAVMITRTSIALEPVPRAAAVGAELAFEAVIHERMREPELEVGRAHPEHGRVVTRLDLERGRGGRVSGRVACVEAGRIDVELAATSSRGRVALARFPVWCGAPAPERYVAAPPGIDAGTAELPQAERRLIALVNRDRVEAGVPPLRSDPQLTETARKRAAVLRDTLGIAPRLDDSAVEVGVSASGAAGRGVGAVYEALANEPRDRERMLSPLFTHLGLGAASSSDHLFASLMFLTVPPPIDLEQGRRIVAGHLTKAGEVLLDVELADIAQRYATQAAAGRDDDAIWRELKPLIDRAGRHYTRMEQTIVRGRSINAAKIVRGIDFAHIDDFGVGVAQADHPTFGRRTIWVVVFWGKRLGAKALGTPKF